MRNFAKVFILICWLSVSASAESVRLAWDRNKEPDVVHYNVFFGEVGAAATIILSNETTATVPNLVPGKQYFFYVTAVASSGLESDPSTQIVHTVRSAVGQFRTPGKAANGNVRLEAVGRPGQRYAIQATASLTTPSWNAIATATADGNGLITVEDPERLPKRFYRSLETN